MCTVLAARRSQHEGNVVGFGVRGNYNAGSSHVLLIGLIDPVVLGLGGKEKCSFVNIHSSGDLIAVW